VRAFLHDGVSGPFFWDAVDTPPAEPVLPIDGLMAKQLMHGRQQLERAQFRVRMSLRFGANSPEYAEALASYNEASQALLATAERWRTGYFPTLVQRAA